MCLEEYLYILKSEAISISVSKDTLALECRKISKGNVRGMEYSSLHYSYTLDIRNVAMGNATEEVSLVTVSETTRHGNETLLEASSEKLNLHPSKRDPEIVRVWDCKVEGRRKRIGRY